MKAKDIEIDKMKDKFNKELKAKDNEVALIKADGYKAIRQLTKQITLLEDEAVRLKHSHQLAQDNLQYTVDTAVREAKKSERQHYAKINKELSAKIAIAEKEKLVSQTNVVHCTLHHRLPNLIILPSFPESSKV